MSVPSMEEQRNWPSEDICVQLYQQGQYGMHQNGQGNKNASLKVP